MQKALAIISNPSVRRLLVFLLSLGTVALHRKFGIQLDAEEMVGVVVLALGYITQSSAKEASVARTDALKEMAAPAVPSTPQP